MPPLWFVSPRFLCLFAAVKKMHSDSKNSDTPAPPAHAHPEVRRQDRLLDDAGQQRLLDEGEYGFLAMNTGAGGYGIPISFVRAKTTAGDDRIYFHCAPEGRKLDALEKDNRVSFCVVGRTQVIPEKFTTAYESVIVFGKVTTRLTDDERRAALRLLVKKYCPDFIDIGEKYMEASFHRTHILRLDIGHRTGKTKRATPMPAQRHERPLD